MSTGNWSTGLCSWCAEPGGIAICLYGYFCPCCLYGTNIGKLPADSVYCGGNCFGACCCYSMMWSLGLCCLLHMGARTHIRNKYGIGGSSCGDCMLTMFCPVCALCQENREINKAS